LLEARFPCYFLVNFISLHFSLQVPKFPFARKFPCKWKHCTWHLAKLGGGAAPPPGYYAPGLALVYNYKLKRTKTTQNSILLKSIIFLYNIFLYMVGIQIEIKTFLLFLKACSIVSHHLHLYYPGSCMVG
jgi:hypothetical protein